MKAIAGLLAGLALAADPLAAQGTLVLTPDGLGPVRIGMSQKQVIAALGGTLTGEPIENEDVCVEKDSSELEGVGFMFEGGTLTRITLAPGTDITTPRGIGPGASADAVRRAYGKSLQSEPNTYIEAPAEYLTLWTVRDQKGVRFETDEKRKVYLIHAGGASIQYIEGCA